MKSLTFYQKLTLFIILITGVALRFYNYSEWSLSNDELSALNRLRFSSFEEVLEQGVKLNDMHPPGVQVFLYIYTGLFGVSEAAIRLPFVLMGALAVYIFFLIAYRWFNVNVALLSTAAFSGLIFPILYSQLARPYSPGLLFTLLGVYYWSKLLFDKELLPKTIINWKNYFAFVFSAAAAMYTHYFSFLFMGLTGIAGVFFVKGKMRWFYLGSAVLLFVFYLPAWPVFTYQFGIGGLGGDDGWLGPPKQDTFFRYIEYIFNDSFFLAVFYALLSLVLFVSYKGKKEQSPFRKLSLLFFLLPFLIAYYYSVYKNPVYQHSIMLFSFPYLLLFLFSVVPAKLNEKYSMCLSILVLGATTFSSVAEKKFYSTQYFGVFKEPAQKTIAYNQRYGKENVTSTINVIIPYYINYYHEKYNSAVDYKLYSCNTPSGLAQLNKIAAESSTAYFSYGWSNTANPEETDEIITQYFPKVIEHIDYFNSGIRLYANTNSPDSGTYFTPDFKTENDFEKLLWGEDGSMQSMEKVRSGMQSIKYTQEKEFGPTWKKSFRELQLEDTALIWLKVWIFAEQVPLNGSLVMQVDDEGKTVVWRGASFKDYVLEPGKWQPVYLAYRITEPFSKEASISCYVWNSAKITFYADDFSVKIFR